MSEFQGQTLHASRWKDRWFQLACVLESGLAVLAMVLSAIFGLPLWRSWSWSLRDLALGLAGTLPLLGALCWLLHTRTRVGHSILEFLDQIALPVFARWSALQLGIVSVFAGIGEELLFRGVVQAGLAHLWGDTVGLVTASLIFGVAHLVTPAYGVMAALVGVYLGLLWMGTGNLLVPVVTHAVYDFMALVWLLRLRNPLKDRADH